MPEEIELEDILLVAEAGMRGVVIEDLGPQITTALYTLQQSVTDLNDALEAANAKHSPDGPTEHDHKVVAVAKQYLEAEEKFALVLVSLATRFAESAGLFGPGPGGPPSGGTALRDLLPK